MMKITVLNDDTAGNGCSAEHGLSFLVEAGVTFLFDTGPSDIFSGTRKFWECLWKVSAQLC